MVFSSLIFVCLFLPVTVLTYVLSPAHWRNHVLVYASMIFYAWNIPLALLLVLALIGINFYIGPRIEAATGAARQRAIGLAVGFNIAVLIFFKYTDFVLQNLNDLIAPVASLRVPLPNIGLPLGISFFTFHIVSYLVDIYRGKVRAQRSLSAFALYIINFPQLIAGPIVRYHQIADQLPARPVQFSDFDAGVSRFVVGLAKKLLIANPIGAVADQIFMVTPHHLSSETAWLGGLCYALQIYFDFSGYSDMAIGLARMFGFRFPENFNYPYSARSVQDFWRRWHMTLSSWFRDYVYIPMGGNRGGPWQTARNLWIVFLLTGLWHGASWNFVVWGLWYGVFLTLERIEPVSAILGRLPKLAQHAYLLAVVYIGWIFFRAPDLTYAVQFLGRLVGLGEAPGQANIPVDVSPNMMALIVLACGLSQPVWPRLRAAMDVNFGRDSISGDLLRAALIATVMILSLATMTVEERNPFIYFQF